MNRKPYRKRDRKLARRLLARAARHGARHQIELWRIVVEMSHKPRKRPAK